EEREAGQPAPSESRARRSRHRDVEDGRQGDPRRAGPVDRRIGEAESEAAAYAQDETDQDQPDAILQIELRQRPSPRRAARDRGSPAATILARAAPTS